MLKIGEFSKMSHLTVKAQSLSVQRDEIDVRLSIINHILEDEEMKYQITEKNIPAATVYYSETVLKQYQDIMKWKAPAGKQKPAAPP